MRTSRCRNAVRHSACNSGIVEDPARLLYLLKTALGLLPFLSLLLAPDLLDDLLAQLDLGPLLLLGELVAVHF